MALDIRLQYGPILLGVCFNLMLYGVSAAQTYHYYLTYTKDKVWIKYLVFYLFTVETINAGCVIYIIYQPLIEKFGLVEATEVFPTLFAAQPISVVFISTPIQVFFAWRIWLITKSKIFPAIITVFAILSLVGGIWTGYGAVKVKVFARAPELHTQALIWLLSACAADILITVILVFTLRQKKTGFIATDDIISKIIRLTVQTGLLTTICALADVLLFMILPNTALSFIFDFSLTRLYSNTLLSSLNARAALQLSSSDYRSAPRHGAGASTWKNDGAVALESMSPKGYGRSEVENDTPVQHVIGSYELESSKSLDHGPDVEYGIKITRVVETKEDTLTATNHTQ